MVMPLALVMVFPLVSSHEKTGVLRMPTVSDASQIN